MYKGQVRCTEAPAMRMVRERPDHKGLYVQHIIDFKLVYISNKFRILNS